MAYGIYLSAEGALAQQTRMDAIANNLANVDTAGFKRDVAMFASRLAEEMDRGHDAPGSGSINNVGGGIEVLVTETDFSMGPLKPTGLPTDLAVRGDGFFVVSRDGERMLTRAGNFQIDANGFLRSGEAGYPVLSEAGDLVRITGPWLLSPDGTVQQPDGAVRLALVEPDDYRDLIKSGENLYAPAGEVRPLDDARRDVLQGYVEGSGVKATQEMMQMIETSRLFEANISLIRSQDQLLGTLIGRVLRV